MEAKINYENYSLAELQDALANINGEKYPERKAQLEQLVAAKLAAQKQAQALSHSQNSKSTMQAHTSETRSSDNHWVERFAAFLFDCLFAYGPYYFIDKVLPYPLPYADLALVGMIWFIAYFALFEVILGKPTPGKRIKGLKLQHIGGGAVGKGAALFRIVFISLILFDVTSSYSFDVLGFDYLHNTILLLFTCTFFYSIYLAVWSESGRTVWDILAKSWVVSAKREISAEDSQVREWQGAKGFIGISLLCLIATFAFQYQMTESTSESAADDQQAVDTQASDEEEATPTFSEQMEQLVLQQLNTRSKVSIFDKQIWRTGQEGSVRSLEIKVWLPWMAYTDENREKIAALILDNLTVTKGYYDEGELIFSSELIFGYSRSIELNLP